MTVLTANLESTFSIGEVAEAVGIGVFTLRQWERRYGSPRSQKLPSGHRRYSSEEVSRLRLVKLALEARGRPAEVVPASSAQLTEWLSEQPETNAKVKSEVETATEQIIFASHEWDHVAITRIIEKLTGRLGELNFLTEFVGTLMERVGRHWEKAIITVAHEHFISEIVKFHLVTRWQQSNRTTKGQPFVLASLPEEAHDLGLHMCANILTLARKKVLFLGCSTPLQEIVETAQSSNAQAVCLTISAFGNLRNVRRNVTTLRRQLPDDVCMYLGGAGAPINIDGCRTIKNLDSFYKNLKGLAHA